MVISHVGFFELLGFSVPFSVPQCLPFHFPLNPVLFLPCRCVLLALLFLLSLVGKMHLSNVTSIC